MSNTEDRRVTDALCNGKCEAASDFNEPGGTLVAMAHPDCFAHFEGWPIDFEFDPPEPGE